MRRMTCVGLEKGSGSPPKTALKDITHLDKIRLNQSINQPIYVLCARLHLTLCSPMDCSHQALLSMEFSRQEYWNGLSFPTSGGFSPTQRLDLSLLSLL